MSSAVDSSDGCLKYDKENRIGFYESGAVFCMVYQANSAISGMYAIGRKMAGSMLPTGMCLS